MKAGHMIGRWTLLYPGRNAAGNEVWLCQCRCLVIREVLASDLTPRPPQGTTWTCGHRAMTTPRTKIGRTSRFRGVSHDGARCHKQPWRVALYVEGRHLFVGRYATEEDAGRAYDTAVSRLFGPAALVNFPKKEERLTA
jgi:hypothetical protein